MYYLEQACRIQLTAQSSGAPLALPSTQTVQRTRAQFSMGPGKGWLPWQALRRKLDREQPEYVN
jgi:ribulose-5-phosphate 4-epimerase/fuculose-1-phosphate aldolase